MAANSRRPLIAATLRAMSGDPGQKGRKPALTYHFYPLSIFINLVHRTTIGNITLTSHSILPGRTIMRTFVLAVLVLLATPEMLLAQTVIPKLDDAGHKGDLARAEKQRAAERFDTFDLDKNGSLSREEVANRSAYLNDNFDKLDANKDGQLSWEEFIGHNRWPK